MNRAGDVEVEKAMRAWVERELPAESGLAERAARVAATAYDEGATADEAYRRARSYVRSWCSHPSHQSRPRPRAGRVASLAS